MLGYATVLIAGTYFVAAYFLKLPQMTQGIAMARRRLPRVDRSLPAITEPIFALRYTSQT